MSGGLFIEYDDVVDRLQGRQQSATCCNVNDWPSFPFETRNAGIGVEPDNNSSMWSGELTTTGQNVKMSEMEEVEASVGENDSAVWVSKKLDSPSSDVVDNLNVGALTLSN